MTEEVRKIMGALKCSEEEALDVIAYDKAVDRATTKAQMAQLPYELTDEQKKVAKKMTNIGEKTKKPMTMPKGNRPKKENPTKQSIIETIHTALAEMGVDDLNITNPERIVEFKLDGQKYTVTLTANRKG